MYYLCTLSVLYPMSHTQDYFIHRSTIYGVITNNFIEHLRCSISRPIPTAIRRGQARSSEVMRPPYYIVSRPHGDVCKAEETL